MIGTECGVQVFEGSNPLIRTSFRVPPVSTRSDGPGVPIRDGPLRVARHTQAPASRYQNGCNTNRLMPTSRPIPASSRP